MTQTTKSQIRLRRIARWNVYCALVACFICQVFSGTEKIQMKTVHFDMPEGKAIDTLKEAALQADVDIVFSGRLLRKVDTPAVEGEYVPKEVFDLMLAGTSLAVFQHEKSGVYSIRKAATAEDANGGIQTQNQQTQPLEQTDMKIEKNKWLKTLAVALTLGITGAEPQLYGQDSDENKVYELSPFTIDAGDNVGYRATSTLAGSRLKTPLRDVGSAIQVITEELFEDTGSTTMEEILPYALNTEAYGTMGNFSGGKGSNHRGRFEQDLQRRDPQSAQRVRGLAPASLTRDFFLTDIPFEGYNTSRVAVSRGANSLLFGVGAAGGVINNSLKKARVDGADSGEVSFRYGERDSHRATLDFHRSLVEDRLALRVMSLYKDTRYKQRPAYEIDKRISVSVDSLLFVNDNVNWLGKTKLRADAERGDIHGSPPNFLPPVDGITHFFEAPDIETLQNIPGVKIPGYYISEEATGNVRSHPEFGYGTWNPKQTYDTRLGFTRGNTPAPVERHFHRMIVPLDSAGVMIVGDHQGSGFAGSHGSARGSTGYVDENGDPVAPGPATHGIGVDGLPYKVVSDTFNYIASGNLFMGVRNGQLFTNFTPFSIMDRNIWDNQNLLFQGDTQSRSMDFKSHTITLEQDLFEGKGGIEIAFDNQAYSTENLLPFSAGGTIGDSNNGDLFIDVNEYLLNGQPNPNLGRPIVRTPEIAAPRLNETQRDSARATAFYNLDFEEMYDGKVMQWLGNHTLTGYYNEQSADFYNLSLRNYFAGESLFLGDPEYYNRPGRGVLQVDFRAVHTTYVGADVRQLNSPSEVRINQIDVDIPEVGDAFQSLLFNADTNEFEVQSVTLGKAVSGGGRRRNDIDTEVFSLQSRFLNNHLVGLAGWRSDSATTWENITQEESEALGIPWRDGAYSTSAANPDRFRISADPSDVVSADTFTWSLVGHMPENWLGDLPVGISLHAGESENFQIAPTRRNVRGNVIGLPSGKTREEGITFNLFNGKVIARLNWYETSSDLDTLELGGTSTVFS